MRALLSPPLRPGDRIGIVAPAGPVRQPELDRGMAYLRDRGFVLVPGAHLRDRHGYLAGHDPDRLADVNRMLADPSLAAIWFARGGFGSARIVADLRWCPLRKRPKSLIGFSDLTVVHAAAYRRLRLSTFYGPTVSRLGDGTAFDEASLWNALMAVAGPIQLRFPSEGTVRPGRSEGPLLGGCLSLLASLVGTPFEAPMDGAILFWEEVGEEPYRIDRMLTHLRLSGRLSKLRGMVVGAPVGCEAKDASSSLPLEEILRVHLRGTRYPVVVNVPAGHGPGAMTLPLGRRCRLDTRAGALTFLPS